MFRYCLLILLAACTSLTHADVLTLPSEGADTVPTVVMTLPEQGQRMDVVQQRFGAPSTRHAPVGGDRPEHPPITRWDYPEFSVFFERDRVIDTVVKQAPKPLRNTDALQPAS
jgi:hypothetical protein